MKFKSYDFIQQIKVLIPLTEFQQYEKTREQHSPCFVFTVQKFRVECSLFSNGEAEN